MSNIIYGLISNVVSNAITPRISFPLSINCNIKNEEITEVKDLDFFQMEKLLRWMRLFFDDNENDNENYNENTQESCVCENEDEKNIKNTQKAYKKELYNIYKCILSDYKQYQHWQKYNKSLWILPSVRSKNTKDLSKKIISDIQLFNEGIKMFSLLNK